MLADQDIFDGAHIGEQADILVSTRDASIGDLVGSQADQRFPVEKDFARLRFVETGDAVIESGLPGAVWTDDAEDGIFLDDQVDGVDRGQAAELLGQGTGFKCDGHFSLPSSGVSVTPVSFSTSIFRREDGMIPAGRQSIMTTSSAPKTSTR